MKVVKKNYRSPKVESYSGRIKKILTRVQQQIYNKRQMNSLWAA